MKRKKIDENSNEIALKEEVALLSSIIRGQEEEIAELRREVAELADMHFEDEISDEEEYEN